MSNIRAYYAEFTTSLLTGELAKTTDNVNVGNNLDAKLDADLASKDAGDTFNVEVSGVTMKQTKDEWQTSSFEVAGVKGGKDETDPGVDDWTSTVGTPCKVSYEFTVSEDGDYVLTGVGFSANASVTP